MRKVFKIVSFNNVMFRKKMLIIYLLGVFLPMLIISSFYCASIVNRVKQTNIREIEFDTDVTAEAVERVIDKARMISDEIYYNTSLNKRLLEKNGTIGEYFEIAEEINSLTRYATVYDFVESMHIYTFNDKLYRSDVLMKISDIPGDSHWYSKFLSMGTDYAVISYFEKGREKPYVSIVRRLHNYGRCKDILKINISYAALTNEMIYNKDKGSFCLFNEDGLCIAVSSGEKSAEYLGNWYETINLPENSIEKKLRFPVGYTMYCEYESNYAGNVAAEVMWFILLVCAVLIISYVMVYIASYSMIEKMHEMTEATEKMQQGNFVRISEEGIGDDEIGTLTRAFNMAVDKINMLINEVYNEKLRNAEIEKERSKTEFIALQRQINPHFIFNILEILRMKCVKTNNGEIAGIIKNLSVMLRQQISWKKDIITFEEETVFINAFIELCKCNFDDDVTVKTDVDEEISRCLVPKMSVHVFVENAFRHGLDSLAQNRVFELSAKKSDDRLVIRVSDNGKGIDEKLVDAINCRDIEYIKAMSGDGLANVFARLKLYFKDDFEIAVSSVPYEKTEFCLRLPIKTYDEEWSELEDASGYVG